MSQAEALKIAQVPDIPYRSTSPTLKVSQESESLRALLLIDGMDAITAGGTERQLLQMVKIAQQNGVSPQICVLRRTHWLTPDIAGCPVRHCNLESMGSGAGLRKLAQLYRWMREQRFDMLQTFFTDCNLIGPPLGRLAGIPVVVGTRRNLNDWMAQSSLAWRIGTRLSSLFVDEILTNSEAVLARVCATEGVPARKMSVVYNGVDIAALRVPHRLGLNVRRELQLGEDHLLVGNISGLRRVKGIDLFIEAAALAYAAHPEMRFFVVGEGEMRPKLESLIRERKLEGIVTLLGAKEDVRPYLAAMDIAVLCSDAEGFSNSILEYMAAGLPVVATDVGGNREALGNAGLLVPAADAAALARALVSLTDAETRDRFSYAAIQAVRKFDISAAAARMGALYRGYAQVVEKKRK